MILDFQVGRVGPATLRNGPQVVPTWLHRVCEPFRRHYPRVAPEIHQKSMAAGDNRQDLVCRVPFSLLKIVAESIIWRFQAATPLKTKDFQLKTHLDRIPLLFGHFQCPARACYIRYVSWPEYRRISRRGRPARLRGAPRIEKPFLNNLHIL